jgi:uncharacterized protein (TIGR02588 family)
MGEEQKPKKPEDDQPPPITALEWVVAIVSAICILALLGFLINEQVSSKQLPPDISLKLEGIEKQSDQYLARVSVHNSGDKTASRVECAAELKFGSNQVEQSTARLEFVPPHSRKKIGFIFQHNPSEGELRLSPLGFEER